ncbi:baculoviral IAP repeat-containing protein 1e-like [Rana temporaria]|uniref:baculoviral IAP repeat-containing protein 1e-like n=1 Tax=Rana temporaria TaxID=8407 RepID=UPI001AACE429|nr:baculoviral IAP repeat-containing protein 1e-like [Rana temporaria]
MASEDHNDGKKEKENQPHPIKSILNSVFNFDWEKFTSDFAEQNAAIRKQLGTSKKTEMRSEARRLKSFQAFRDSNFEKFSWWSPSEMANAGLYHTGVSNSLQCFCCGVVINKRPLTYPPKRLHVIESPTCPFMKGDDVGNISMFEVRVQPPDLDHVSPGAYATEEARHKSFTNWPSYATIQPDQLVSAGFIFTGRRDAVQCFSCGGCLGNWQENDDPWKEHAKWFPECAFLKRMKTHKEITEYIDSYSGFKGIRGKDFISNNIDWTLPIQPCAANLNVFENENVRLESFKKWPANANVDPASLARWGFFYTGKGDAVRCYTCGICIHSFQPGEDPMTEHVKHSSDCTFLKRMLEIRVENTENISLKENQLLVDQPHRDVDKKELHNIESCVKTPNVHCPDKKRELRRCLTDVYNNSTFSNMLPFPEFSHISVDLRSLFADISVLLKDTRNRPLRQLTLPDVLSELGEITMIEGEAGSGKTALLKKIAILWASGKCPILNRFNLVFYISVSSTQEHQSLCDIICQQLKGSAASLTEESLGEIIQQLKEKVLFLLDDYSLVDSASRAIEELITNNPWNRTTLAVTVSTSASCKVRQYAKNILSIQDFPLFSSSYILKQLFSHNTTFLETFGFYLLQPESAMLQAALTTPLFAFALCVFWVQNVAENKSQDFFICTTYLMHKILKYSTEKDKIEAAVLSCGQLALDGIFQSRFEFTQENLDKAGVQSEDALRFGLLSRFTSQRLKPIFKFFHPLFQEYLAGRKMNELLQSEDVAENKRGLFYLQKINTFLGVQNRYHSFLKYSCMYSPKTATSIISHLFSLMSNPKAFAHERATNFHYFLDVGIVDSILSIKPELSQHFVVRMLLEFAIDIANKSKYLDDCAPIILHFIKDKDIAILKQADLWLLKFLHKYPEGLMLMKSLEIHLPHGMNNAIPAFWNSEGFKSIWTVPTVEEDYSNAFRYTSDILTKPEFKYINSLKVPDLSKLGFDPDQHKISVLRIKAMGGAMEDENILGNIMVFCNLANRIELDLSNFTGFLNFIWPVIDLYKASIMKLSLKATEFSREEEELFIHLTSLEILQINEMPPPEYILLNIHNFKELKELEVECPTGKWDIIGVLPDEFKSLQRIEKLVFKNENMETQCEQLAKMIDHFPNLNSFTIQCNHCPEFKKVITSLCQNTKMETLCIKKPMLSGELIHLASVLPSLKNLKILEVDDQYSVDVEASETFAKALASLEKLEEFIFPRGTAARQTVSCFIQQLKHMPNLRKLCINHRPLTDSSLLELGKVCAYGYVTNLQALDLNLNQDITQSGWGDFFNIIDNVPKLQHFGISRPIQVQFKTEPITLIALIRCVSKLHNLKQLDMFGWLLDEKDLELLNEMKSEHPNGNSLTLFWQTTLPFHPIIEK